MGNCSTVAVIGGGNGALAAAVDLTLKGFRVNLCNPYRGGESIQPLMADLKIDYVGVLGQGTASVKRVTAEAREAVVDADLVMICIPATAHEAAAGWLAPVLSPGMSVLLNPGHTGGALHFLRALREAGYAGRMILGETNTLTYIARKKDVRTINITGINNVQIAALPAGEIDTLMATVSPCYPDLRPSRTVLGTSLRNLNAMMHPPVMILSAAWIEYSSGDFNFYYDAATPAVARLMKGIDDERLAIGAQWGERLEPLIDLLVSAGVTTSEARKGDSLQRAFKESLPNRWIKAPSSLDHRYMHEDIAYGLVPMAALGEIVGVGTPIMRSMIQISSVISGIDYWSWGLNVERLGLTGLSPAEVLTFLVHGR